MKNQLRQAIALGLWLLTFGLAATTDTVAQERTLTVKAPSVTEGEVMTITVSATPTMKIDQVNIFFRPFGSSQYLQTPANAQGSSYVARIAGQYVLTPSFEFYVVATLTDKSQVTYPLLSPANSPESITILPKPENENLIILSPNRGEKLTAEDGLVSVSFYRIASKADRKTAKLLVDGQNVTSQAIVTTDLVTYIPPSNLAPGLHKVSFDIKDAGGKSFGPIEWSFSIVKPQEKSSGAGVSEAERVSNNQVKYRSNDFLELRNEKISGVSTFYSRLGLQGDASYKWLDFGASTYLTNEEKPEFQPRDRYQLYAKSPILDVKVGDVYPDYSYYLTNGLRVRGVEANLHTGPLKVDVASGQTVRAVDAPVDVQTLSKLDPNYYTRRDSLIQSGYIPRADSTLISVNFTKTLLGTYARHLFTARLGLGGAGGGFNLQVLRSTDDTLSVANGTNPQQNVAAGIGFNFNPVPGRAEFFVEGAFSMTNTDIRGGGLSLALFDSLTGGTTGTDIDSKLKFLGGFDGISKNLIVLNQNLSPLNPLDLSSVAYHAGANLNFFGNLFKLEYLRNGPNYNSFGLSYFQADQMGIRISDRLRLLQNKLFISLAFESLHDNLSNQKNINRTDSIPLSNGTITARKQTFDGTTTRTLFRGGVSTFLGGDIPNFRVDYAVQSNSNKLPNSFVGRNPTNTADSTIYLTASTIDNTTGTLTLDVSKGFIFSGGSNLQAGISAMFSSRTDNRNANVLAYNLLRSQSLLTQDFSTRALTLNATYTFATPLVLNASFSNQYSSLTSGFVAGAFVKTQPAYNTADLSGTYGFLNNKLRATAKTSFTFGDFKRTLLGLYGDYQITDNMNLTAELTTISVDTGVTTSHDLLAGIRYQINFGN